MDPFLFLFFFHIQESNKIGGIKMTDSKTVKQQSLLKWKIDLKLLFFTTDYVTLLWMKEFTHMRCSIVYANINMEIKGVSPEYFWLIIRKIMVLPKSIHFIHWFKIKLRIDTFLLRFNKRFEQSYHNLNDAFEYNWKCQVWSNYII